MERARNDMHMYVVQIKVTNLPYWEEQFLYQDYVQLNLTHENFHKDIHSISPYAYGYMNAL
jgi:hypothetical protein